MRTCLKCKKQSDSFYRGMTRCVSCINQQHSEYYRKNREKVLRVVRVYNERNREAKNKYLRYYRLKTYGLSEVDYKLLLSNQNGACAICLTSSKTLCVDHCHTTGKVRGLLCRRCNLLIGYAKDSVTVLQEAIKYVSSKGEINATNS